MAVNEAQRAQWNADIQARTWPKRERITLTVTPVLLEALALRAGESVLDVGCGGGVAAIAAARAVSPGGSVTGLDISAPLIALATQRASGEKVDNVRFVTGDAQVDRAPGAPFDAVMSQFGVMFFDDPVGAMTNLRGQLRPNGRLVFACWQPPEKNAWFPAPVMAKYQPPPRPSSHGGPPASPFAFANPDYVERVLTTAGFEGVECRPFTLDVVVPEDSIIERENVDAMPIDAASKDAAWQDLQALVKQFLRSDGQLHFTIAPQLVLARNPA
jgi:SAM-dependent methyltransferase